MTFNTYGNKENPSLMLIPGLGVSYEIFLPLIELLKNDFYIIAVGIDGFLIGQESQFTSIDDQAVQVIGFDQENFGGLCFIRTISMSYWTNARKFGLMAKERPCAMAIRTSIPINWNPSKDLTSIFGTAQRRRLWPNTR